MPVARYRNTPLIYEVDAVRYDGWDTNGPEVVDLLGPAFEGRVAEPDEIMATTPHGTSALDPGNWVVRFVSDQHVELMSAATFADSYAL